MRRLVWSLYGFGLSIMTGLSLLSLAPLAGAQGGSTPLPLCPPESSLGEGTPVPGPDDVSLWYAVECAHCLAGTPTPTSIFATYQPTDVPLEAVFQADCPSSYHLHVDTAPGGFSFFDVNDRQTHEAIYGLVFHLESSDPASAVDQGYLTGGMDLFSPAWLFDSPSNGEPVTLGQPYCCIAQGHEDLCADFAPGAEVRFTSAGPDAWLSQITGSKSLVVPFDFQAVVDDTDFWLADLRLIVYDTRSYNCPSPPEPGGELYNDCNFTLKVPAGFSGVVVAEYGRHTGGDIYGCAFSAADGINDLLPEGLPVNPARETYPPGWHTEPLLNLWPGDLVGSPLAPGLYCVGAADACALNPSHTYLGGADLFPVAESERTGWAYSALIQPGGEDTDTYLTGVHFVRDGIPAECDYSGGEAEYPEEPASECGEYDWCYYFDFAEGQQDWYINAGDGSWAGSYWQGTTSYYAGSALHVISPGTEDLRAYEVRHAEVTYESYSPGEGTVEGVGFLWNLDGTGDCQFATAAQLDTGGGFLVWDGLCPQTVMAGAEEIIFEYKDRDTVVGDTRYANRLYTVYVAGDGDDPWDVAYSRPDGEPTPEPTPTATPWPTPTPAQTEDPLRCSQYEWASAIDWDDDPVVELDDIEDLVTPGGCYTLVPGMEWSLPQLLGGYSLTIDQYGICIDWVRFPTVSVLGLVLSLDWFLLPIFAWIANRMLTL